MASILVSLVGFQPVSVVSPILSIYYKKVKDDLKSIYLMHTGQTQGVVQKISQLFTSRNLSARIECIRISNALNDNESPNLILKDIIAKNPDSEVLFNLAGGENYQIAACLTVLPIESSTFLYPSSESLLLFKVAKLGQIIREKYATTLLSIEEILTLQGITYEKGKKRVDKSKIQVLLNSLKSAAIIDKIDEQFGTSVKVGDIEFDYLFSSNNELIFVKDYDQGKYPDILGEARQLISLANNRKDFGELLHHKIVAITSSTYFYERLAEESGGKVVVINPKFNINKFSISAESYLRFCKIENFQNPEPKDFREGVWLYVALGREILPTLKAIWSHKPEKLIILYTPFDTQIKRYIEAFKVNITLLPCRELELIPTDITGMQVLESIALSNKTIECNITPGTKGQGAALALLGVLLGGSLWSIHQVGKGFITQIPEGKRFQVSIPPLQTILKLKGFNNFTHREFSKETTSTYQAFRNLLRRLIDNQLIDNLGIESVELQDIRYDLRKKEFELGGKVYNISAPTFGFFFEEFVAWSLVEAGADQVCLNATLPWSDSHKHKIETKFGVNSAHRTEVDILATYKGNIFAISCKSGEVDSKKKISDEVKGVVPILGRFTIPLVACLKHKGNPVLVQNVIVFGAETLVESDKMKDLLDHAIELPKTSNKAV